MKVVVIGESCEDIFIYGKCERMSPEAPIPVFLPLRPKTNRGMSGNVIENVKSISNHEVVGVHQKEIITKTRYVDDKSNHMFLRVDEGEGLITELHMTEEIRDTIRNADLTIVSDYDKGFLSNNTLFEIAYLSKMSIIDTKKVLTPQLCQIYSFIKLNRGEYQNNITNFKGTKRDRDLLWKKTIVTEGSLGATYQGVKYPTPSPKETIDVSGAGDTFTASFIIKYMETYDMGESIIYANEMSSIVVSKRGVNVPYERI